MPNKKHKLSAQVSQSCSTPASQHIGCLRKLLSALHKDYKCIHVEKHTCAAAQRQPTCISRVADHSPVLVDGPAPLLLPPAAAALRPCAVLPSLLPSLLNVPGICDSILVRLPVKVRTSWLLWSST